MKRGWRRRLVVLTLVVVPVAVSASQGASSVRMWMDQNDQRAEAQLEADRLDARVDDLDAEIARRTSDEAVRQEALCFGPYVAPGIEVYAVAGLQGCVTRAVGG